MTPATRIRLRQRLRRLPRPVPPVQDETIVSYVGRLAVHNYLAPGDLLNHLKEFDRRLPYPSIALDSLAAITGLPERSLAYALPETRSPTAAYGLREQVGPTTVGGLNRQRPLCRLCAATKGISATVMVWACCHRNVCLRHNLWVGQGVQDYQDQLDVADLPEIPQAQVEHRKLIRRFSQARVEFFYADACEIEQWASRNICTVARSNDRRNRLLARERRATLPWPYHYATQYPETVRILGVISSPFWHQLAISGDISQRKRFYDEIDRKVDVGVPAGRNRRLTDWIQEQRRARQLIPHTRRGPEEQPLFASRHRTLPAQPLPPTAPPRSRTPVEPKLQEGPQAR
jgi:hypothetical protein